MNDERAKRRIRMAIVRSERSKAINTVLPELRNDELRRIANVLEQFAKVLEDYRKSKGQDNV